ncbi:unnamed protein product [Echinostoma caproni]|uniref:Reverse transcriptase domain-containing protein n=1 Tax=Echinostoma caproni TaxID=27848 RepID=A0A183BE32_9TREM|nr:unnamed protein product [Echinostoma caproni]
MTVHPSGAISSPFCANFALKTTVNKFGQRLETSVGSCAEHYFYVDDFLGSFDSIKEAVRHIRDLSKLLHIGGFMLTSRQAIGCIPVDERSLSFRDLYGSPLTTDRALGVQWDSEKDEFLFQIQLPEKTATRREILFSLASLYDPMSFVAPWLLPGTILLLYLCRKKITWDEPYVKRITRTGKAGG